MTTPVQIRTKPKPKAPRKTPEPPRVDLFTIDDTVYTMLADPPFQTCLKIVRTFETRGDVAGGQAAIQLMAGEDALRALENYEDLTKEEYWAVVGRILDVVVGNSRPPETPGN